MNLYLLILTLRLHCAYPLSLLGLDFIVYLYKPECSSDECNSGNNSGKKKYSKKKSQRTTGTFRYVVYNPASFSGKIFLFGLFELFELFVFFMYFP